MDEDLQMAAKNSPKENNFPHSNTHTHIHTHIHTKEDFVVSIK